MFTGRDAREFLLPSIQKLMPFTTVVPKPKLGTGQDKNIDIGVSDFSAGSLVRVF